MQVLTPPEDFAVVRDKLQELGQHIDHDLSGLVYTPLAHVEVCAVPHQQVLYA